MTIKIRKWSLNGNHWQIGADRSDQPWLLASPWLFGATGTLPAIADTFCRGSARIVDKKFFSRYSGVVRNETLRESIEDLSFGILSTALNLTLAVFEMFTAISTSSTNPRDVARALEEVSSRTGVDKDSLKRAFWRARKWGLLDRKRERGKQYWRTTSLGRERLQSILPTYHTDRPWDGRLYLITYDIPEEKHSQRTKLRKMLVKLGARRFQDSVYLMLWDPTHVIKQYIEDNGIAGSVIVSDTGTDGSIGERNLHDLIWDVFGLEELNARYQEFIEESQQHTGNLVHLGFLYLSILRDDPQLPFELLGPLWKGNKAYRIYQQHLQTSRITF